MSQGTIFTKVQFGAEASAYGTETSSYSELARCQSCNIDSDNGNIYDRGLGEGINASNVYYGPFTASGNINFDVVDFTVLQHWVGDKAGAGTAGDPYTLTEATSIQAAASGAGIMQPFSIEKLNDDGTDTVQFALGCVGETFTLSGSLNSKLSCSASFVAQKSGYRGSGETYTPNTDPAFVMLNGTWKWGATPSALSGVREFSISMANKLVTDTRTIESRFMGIPHFGQRTYNFTVSIIMSSSLATTIISDFYGYSNAGVYTPEDGSVSVSPTASLEFKVELVNGSNYATIQLDECAIDRISKPAALGGGLSLLSFQGTALKGLSNIPIKWWST